MTRTKPRTGRPDGRPFSPPQPAVPHSESDERAALGCVLIAGGEKSQAEVDSLLEQLTPGLFWLVDHQDILAAMRTLRREKHAVDTVTVSTQILRDRAIGAGERPSVDALRLIELVNKLPEGGHWHNFPTYLETLQGFDLQRRLRAWKDRLAVMANDSTLTLDRLREEFSAVADTVQKTGRQKAALIEVVTVAEAQAYEPNPNLYLFGDDMISKGDICVICGWPGLGKSRLATTLALAGATGKSWMGYKCRRPGIRTLIVQSENSLRRIKSEVQGVDPKLSDFVRFTKPTTLAFHQPEFRRELLAYWNRWQFDLIVIDPWTDVVKAAEAGDVQDAFDNVRMALPTGDDSPAVVIVAHVRKQGRIDRFRPKAGAELMHEVIGSQASVGKARTVFALQPDKAEATSDVVIFDCGKSNNDRPNPASAWQRANGEFRPIPNFDFEEWRRGAEEEGHRKIVTEEHLAEVLRVPKKRDAAIQAIKDLGFSQATAYRSVSGDGKFADRLTFDKDGRIGWKD